MHFYAARAARLDLLRIICKFAVGVVKLNCEGDKRSFRLLRYIWHSAGDRLTGFICNTELILSHYFFFDADFVGDVASRRSNSGAHLAVHGSHSIFPIQCISARQGAVAFSTPDAEWHSACHGYRKVMLLALSLFDIISFNASVPFLHGDSQATGLFIMVGRDLAMRHIGRVHRVSVQWLHPRLGGHPNRDKTVLRIVAEQVCFTMIQETCQQTYVQRHSILGPRGSRMQVD